MKILQLIQKQQYRGAEVFSCQLSNHLIRQGNEVVVMSIFDGVADLPFDGTVQSLSGRKARRYMDFSAWKKLAHFIKEFEPDIIQANAADTLKYAICSKMLHKWNVPVVYRNASSASFYIKDPFSKVFNAFLLKEVDLILSVSHASKEDINKLFPFTSGKTHVVPVGVEEFGVKKRKNAEGLKHILHIGSFTKEKNHFELLKIFKRVVEEDPNVVLDLIGEGPLLDEVKAYAEEKKVRHKINFIGGVENPLAHLQNADVLVLPSLIEGLPGVLLEAMYCRVPVIAYDVGGVGEIVIKNRGNLIEKNNSEAFIKKLKKILQDPGEGEIEQSYQMVREHYLNSQIALKFVKYYKKLVPKND